MNTLRIGDKMRQWRNGAGNAPRHYAGTRSATGRALSRTRSLTAAAVAVAMMATVAITSLIPAYNAKADENNLEDAPSALRPRIRWVTLLAQLMARIRVWQPT